MIGIYQYSTEFGGVDILAARFAAYLHSANIPYVLFTPDDSRIRSEFPHLSFAVREDGRLMANISHMLFPTIKHLIGPIEDFVPSNVKVLVWIVHPNDLFTGFYPFSGKAMAAIGYKAVPLLRRLMPRHAYLVDNWIEESIAGGSIAVMDGATKRSLRYYINNPNANPAIVPIAVSDQQNRSDSIGSGRAASNFGYLGRMDIMKWSALRGVINGPIAAIAKERQASLHLVSEGPLIKEVEASCRRHGIALFQYGYRPNAEAIRLICEKTDMALAMGTSALDLASAGHPVLLIDPSLKTMRAAQSLFRFVHESEECTVGEYRDFPQYERGIRPFSYCCDPHVLNEARSHARDVTIRRHSPAIVFPNLFNKIAMSDMDFSQMSYHVNAIHKSFAAKKSLLKIVSGPSPWT